MYLRSYEWLKLADRGGRYMQCSGGNGLWIIPNPEDSFGSSDYAMLLRAKGVANLFPEWFGSPASMSSAAYVSGSYLREQANRGHSRLSVLFETGLGGHAEPYWAWQSAFNAAYTLTAATQADDFDNDFIDQAPFDQMSKPEANPEEFRRFRDTVAKAFGFKLSREHQAKRVPSKILVLSERPPGKSVTSFLYSVEDTRRPGLAGSLSRAHVAFDMRDSLELERVLERYDVIFYDVLSPRVRDTQRISAWLRNKPGRVLITHSFVPTRISSEYWDSDSGTKFGNVKAAFGLGTLSETKISRATVIDAAVAIRPFLKMNQSTNFSSTLTKSQHGKSLISTSDGSLLTEVAVGNSKVIYLNYTPGLSEKTKQLDDQISKALVHYTGKKALAFTEGNIDVQVFEVPGGQSIVLWDRTAEQSWSKLNSSGTKLLPWKTSTVNQNVQIQVEKANNDYLVYDFWKNKTYTQSSYNGKLKLDTDNTASRIFFIGKRSQGFSKTLDSTALIRRKFESLKFNSLQ